ncbi:response regulator transcription factor [Aerosakkonemataceae cyanobacterium BLCC-F50]|uniref:Response regulator transcription factor n=1 Tax=Floridaenema flaviceps BLCC-F50 TaxID=3153642 RepID=A0ABV4Y0V4_9CYAN
MSLTSLLTKDKIEHQTFSFQVDLSINQALTAVAKEVAEILQANYPFQTVDINSARTIGIRAIEPEWIQVIATNPLSVRELEVLQLIVDGHKNSAIAAKLHITKGTVKTHVRNVLRKLCVEDRTQAAILAFRTGLVH